MAEELNWDDIRARLALAREAGWKFEDTRLTPGIPVLGARRPDGSIAGILGSVTAGDPKSFLAQMDEVGIPR